MSGTSGSGGVGALTIGGVATVVVIIGGVVLNQFGVFDPQEAAPASVEQSAEVPAPAPLADTPEAAVSEKDQPTDQIEAGESASLAAPEIDVIRFDPEGAGLIAGSAEPGAQVLILLDGELIQEHTVGDSGEFVAFPIISPSETPRVLTFELAKGDARAVSDVSFILAPATPVANATADTPVEEVASAPEGDAAETAPVAADEPAAQQQVAAATPDSEPESAPASAPVSAPAPATELVDTTEVQIAETPAVETQRDTIEADTAEVAERTAEATATDAAEAALAQSQADDLVDENIALAQQQNAAEQAAPVEADLNLTQTLGQVASDTPKHAAANIAVVRSSETVPAQAPAIALEGQADTPRTAAEADPAPEVETADPPKPAAVAVLKAGPDGIELVQPAGAGQPAPLNKIALDTISYSAAGEVVLAGRAQPDSLVRVYVDNTPWADITAAPSGSWQGELEGLKPGVYTLRLDELDPLEGKVISRLETPFSRAEPEQLALSTDDVDPSRPSVRVVTVQEGDTLWAISQQRYGTGFLFVRVFEANRTAIRNPDLIYPGQVFTIPE
ncbi:LysM peptidoglycan-binding domain-containing protein [Epibacterium sp. SM1969]|uniref:LysM peptidoglycan-binding domain-containing protein n=1 Tax=Tritonibacter aquimaris TaxID=2663379 RepID=A0A844B1R9_9RHOB|nr:LysM peptidoglycan-binding domain-containing protein [Tritonibacter aquimaris]MQY44282.1 LysM peptidoglycan-binding domain-containing protein [Tritonibacter aquimaris]